MLWRSAQLRTRKGERERLRKKLANRVSWPTASFRQHDIFPFYSSFQTSSITPSPRLRLAIEHVQHPKLGNFLYRELLHTLEELVLRVAY